MASVLRRKTQYITIIGSGHVARVKPVLRWPFVPTVILTNPRVLLILSGGRIDSLQADRIMKHG